MCLAHSCRTAHNLNSTMSAAEVIERQLISNSLVDLPVERNWKVASASGAGITLLALIFAKSVKSCLESCTSLRFLRSRLSAAKQNQQTNHIPFALNDSSDDGRY